MFYISYITIIFHTLYITSINYTFFFPAKTCPVRCLSLILCNYYFSLQIPPRPLFPACIITPVNFIDTFRLLIPSTFTPYLRVSVTNEIYMYQLTSSQTYKMAIKSSQR